MRIFKIALVLTAIVCVSYTAVIAAGNNNVVSRDQVEAAQAVDTVFDAYLMFSLPDFMDILAEEYVPDRMSMVNEINGYLRTIKVLDLNYFIDEVTKNDGKMAVNIKWEKKTRNRNTGVMSKDSDEALLIFKKEKDVWKLSNIKGTNPFM